VVQGALEGSNVDTAQELTRLLSVSNAYTINQRVLGMVDGSLEKAVNEVGRVG
jgi:flagellar basal-body rod protein FlgG